jgi:hypothetical protein
MTYRERRLARAQRLNEWADKREQKANQASQAATELVDGMPLGQPILVGHHSEGKMRRHHARVDARMQASIENGEKANEFRQRAENIENAAERAIYNDDPDALERLREKLASLEAQRAAIRAYNKSCRQGKPDPAVLNTRQRADLESTMRLAPRELGSNGSFPAYKLSNLSGNITRVRGRIEALTRSRADGRAA